MAARLEAGNDRRLRSRNRLATLVAARNETLSLYSDLARQRPFTTDPATEHALRHFCEALIDYTAGAHFQLYRFVAEGRERRQSVQGVADRVYPRIAEITDRILEFNDRYDTAPLEACLPTLADDLSRLGEDLADRIQLEDQLIDAMTR
ncbi:MAG TPA: Rsd/AlgQ family anti-sigma factor [Gammaproteobacteria bacterium]|nr:Rsd/AlgQ family anti-sigma factor [Gammaproteobacteria bacterium]